MRGNKLPFCGGGETPRSTMLTVGPHHSCALVQLSQPSLLSRRMWKCSRVMRCAFTYPPSILTLGSMPNTSPSRPPTMFSHLPIITVLSPNNNLWPTPSLHPLDQSKQRIMCRIVTRGTQGAGTSLSEMGCAWSAGAVGHAGNEEEAVKVFH